MPSPHQSLCLGIQFSGICFGVYSELRMEQSRYSGSIMNHLPPNCSLWWVPQHTSHQKRSNFLFGGWVSLRMWWIWRLLVNSRKATFSPFKKKWGESFFHLVFGISFISMISNFFPITWRASWPLFQPPIWELSCVQLPLLFLPSFDQNKNISLWITQSFVLLTNKSGLFHDLITW